MNPPKTKKRSQKPYGSWFLTPLSAFNRYYYGTFPSVCQIFFEIFPQDFKKIRDFKNQH